MGLEMVEIVMEVEEQFGVRLADEDYQKVRTVGDLYDLVVLKKTERPPARCPSPMFFCRLRRQLMEQFGVRRDQVRLDAALQAFIPRDNRRAHWQSLQDQLGFRLPPLQRSRWLVQSLAAVGWCIPVVAVLLALPSGIGAMALAFLLGLIAAGTFAVFAPGWTDAWAVEIPSECATVRGTVVALRDWNFVPPPDMDPHAAADVDWNRLRAIVSEQLNVPIDEITRESRFIEDLHAD